MTGHLASDLEGVTGHLMRTREIWGSSVGVVSPWGWGIRPQSYG